VRYDLANGKGADIEVLVRKKIKKIPRLQFRDFEWSKEQLETIESSFASQRESSWRVGVGRDLRALSSRGVGRGYPHNTLDENLGLVEIKIEVSVLRMWG
jgi:hypothetical protein